MVPEGTNIVAGEASDKTEFSSPAVKLSHRYMQQGETPHLVFVPTPPPQLSSVGWLLKTSVQQLHVPHYSVLLCNSLSFP